MSLHYCTKQTVQIYLDFLNQKSQTAQLSSMLFLQQSSDYSGISSKVPFYLFSFIKKSRGDPEVKDVLFSNIKRHEKYSS